MGTFHPQHVRGAPAHRPGHAAGHHGGRGRRAVPPADDLSSRARTTAIRAAYDPAQAAGSRIRRPGPADGHPQLPAAGAFLAEPAAGHSFRGTLAKRAAAHFAEFKPEFVTKPEFTAKPKRVLDVTSPEPEFTNSDRPRRLAAIKPVRALAGSYSGSLLNLLGHRQERNAIGFGAK